MKVLVLNSGSSSQKSCLYEIGETLPAAAPAFTWEGKIEFADKNKEAEYSIRTSGGASHEGRVSSLSRGEAIEHLLHGLWGGDTRAISAPSEIDVVGHRVVHGGPQYFSPTFVTPEVKSAIAGVSLFAPLHNRAELEGMEIVTKLFGPVPQVAVFDTGFHRTMPRSSAVYPGPYEWFEQGIRRYGFHGINHQYCAERAAQMLGGTSSSPRLVTCHLGNGCSLAAIRNGQSVDTTMGFTPLEGLMMGTRSGSVDPGIVTYLMRQKKLTGEQLDEILNKQSGLLGVSGISGDMRDVLAAAAQNNDRAKLALEIYIHRLQAAIGAMVAVLGGVDALVFTAGVGENSPEVRAAACENLAFLGVRLDPEKNTGRSDSDVDISSRDAAVRVFVIHAQEDWMIARACWNLMQTAPEARISSSTPN
jgi:acetate kinase